MMNSDDPDQHLPEDNFDMTGRELLGLSLASLVFYLFLATLLFYFFHDEGLFAVFFGGESFPYQLAVGSLCGLAAAGVIIFFCTRSPMKDVLDDYTIFRVISRAEFSSFDRIQVSVFAGVGEEVLFRGAIQPLLGIWVTSILFVAIHGYFKFKSAGHILFGVLLFLLSMMLGVLFETVGLVSAMAAHTVYDLVLLWWVKHRNPGKAAR